MKQTQVLMVEGEIVVKVLKNSKNRRGIIERARKKKAKKTGLNSQGVTEKPGEFSNLVQQ